MNSVLWWLVETTIVVALFVPLVWTFCCFLRRQPATQHTLWVILLLKLALPPIVNWPEALTNVVTEVAPISSQWTAPNGAVKQGRSRHPPVVAESHVLTNASSAPTDGRQPVATRQRDGVRSRAPNAVTVMIVIWFGGALLTVVCRVRQILRLRRRCVASESAPIEVVAVTTRAARALNLKRVPYVVVDAVTSPGLFCLNLGRPTLIWPQDALAEVAKYRGAITHELAHLKRRDHWIAWIDLVMGCIWWWNPLFYYLSRKVRETSEIASDAMALTLSPGSREQYATLFLQLSHATPKSPFLVLSLPTVGGSRKLFERRLSMILDERITGRVSWRGMIMATVLLFTVVPAFSQTKPTEEQTARKAIQNRFAKLQSIVVEYERIDIHTPDRSMINRIESSSEDSARERFEVVIGTAVHQCSFRHLGELSRFEEKLVKGTSPSEHLQEIWSYFPNKVEVFWENPDTNKIGDIRPNPTAPNSLIDLALGLRLQGERKPLTAEQLRQFQMDISDENIVVLRASWWEGKPNPNIVHEWHFDRRLDYALIAYRRVVGEFAVEFVLGNFLNVDGIQLPELIKYRMPSRGSRDSQTTVIRVESYKLDAIDNTRESYAIDWPEGTRMVRR